MWERVDPMWRDLCAATREWSPFLSRVWIGTWIEVFGGALRPNALVWRTADGVAVACVLLSTKQARIGPFRVRRAFINATGEQAVASEHNDLVVVAEHRDEVTYDLVRRVLALGADDLSIAGFKCDGGRQVLACWPTPDVAAGWSEDPLVDLEALRAKRTPYLNALSGNTRSQIRRSLKLYTEKYGTPSIEIAPDADTARAWLEELAELHASRWHARGLDGAFGTDAQRRFHGLVVARAREDGSDLAADMLRVRFGSTTIGLLYTLRRGGVVSFYQSGLVYEDDNRLKPGLVVHALAAEHYLASGAREYDFLAGELEAAQYKRSLSTRSRELLWVDLPAPSARMRAIARLRGLKRGVGQMKRLLKGEE